MSADLRRALRSAAGIASTSGLALALLMGMSDRASAATTSTGIDRTAWQMIAHPAEPFPLVGSFDHGDPGEYQGASIPAANDARWTGAAEPDHIEYDPGSGLEGLDCGTVADYSYFQSYLYIPTGVTPSNAFLDVVVDDGVRLTIYNAAHPSGISPDAGYVTLNGEFSADFGQYLRPGANRIVLTQVDDCYSGSFLYLNSLSVSDEPVPVGDYGWDGFLQPINDTAHQTGQAMSIFKAGSTVPVKFQLRNPDGTLASPSSSPVFLQPGKIGPLTSSATVDESTYTDPGTTGGVFKYDPTTQQWIYNWKTDKSAGGFWYRIGVQLPDGSKQYVSIGLR